MYSHILFSHTFTSIGWKNCIQFWTLKQFGSEVFFGIHFLKSGNNWYFSSTYSSFLWLKNNTQLQTLKFLGMEGSTCHNPFFKRWKKLIVILCFTIHLLPLVAKLYENSNTETFWHGRFCRITFFNTFFERWQKSIGFFNILFVPWIE